MKSITIRGVDAALSVALQALSKVESKSINQFILDLLRKETGLSKSKQFTKTYHDLDDLFGSWSEENYQQIENSINELNCCMRGVIGISTNVAKVNHS